MDPKVGTVYLIRWSDDRYETEEEAIAAAKDYCLSEQQEIAVWKQETTYIGKAKPGPAEFIKGDSQ